MIGHLLTQPLTVRAVTSTTTDVYGDEVDGEYGEPVDVLGYLEQQSSTETTLGRDTTVTRWAAWLPAGTPISRRDRIGYRAQTFEVDGEPEDCYNPRLRLVSHIRCQLTVVAG